MKNQFFNIQGSEITKITEGANKSIADLQTLDTVKDILNNWYYKSVMTEGAKRKTWDRDSLIAYLTERINKDTFKKHMAVKTSIASVSDATKIISSISVSVEWLKNRTWGMCPQAEVRVRFTDNTCDNYTSGRVTGCGYDKESTAIAQAINQCNEFLNLLYTKKDSNIKKENRDLFGYGSGYGVRPYLESGVGVSCYPAIFKSIGFDWQGVSHGKTFDVYTVNAIKL